MPDWAQKIIHNNPHLGAVIVAGTIGYYCYRVFAFVEDRLSVSAKQEITAWLKSAGDFAAHHTLSFNLLSFHSELFGDKQFSVKCLVRTTLFSVTSFLLVFIPLIIAILLFMPKLPFVFFALGLTEYTYGAITYMLVLLIALFILIVFPLDFIGVAVTRRLASLAGNHVNFKKVALIFIYDTLTKAVIFPIMLACFVLFVLIFDMSKLDVTFNLEDVAKIINMYFGSISSKEFLRSTVAPAYRYVVPSLLLCSAWVWLYFVGLHVVRVAVFMFEVDKQPVRSIGIVGAAVLTGCYGLYTMAIGSYSENTLRARGAVYAANQDYDHAIADFNEAIRLDPKSITFDDRGRAYAAKQDYDRAIADYNEAIRLYPESATFDDRGLAYAAKQDYDRAIADFNEAIRLDPKSAGVFFNRGIAYGAKQDYDRAIADFNEAIRLEFTFAAAFNNRGLAIKLGPTFAAAFNNRGLAYAAKQDYDRAIADFNEAIRLDPKSAGVFFNRGIAYAAKQDYDRAIADYNEAIRLDPKVATAFFNRGLAYAAKQDYDRAIADYNEAIRLDPKVAAGFNNRGIAYAAKQDCDRAIADYNEAIRLDPRFPVVFFFRGRAYAAKQDYGRAIADYNEEIRLDPKSAPAYLIRGITYAAKQDYDRAIADFNEAIRLDPKFAYPVLWLYLARARSGAQTAAAELETNAKNLKQPDWPYPVVELFLGRRTPEATLAAPTKPEDRCEAQFYVGEWRLSRGNRTAAVAALKAAAETCPKTPPEYEFARAELHRLGR